MTAQALIVVDVQVGFDDPKWGPRNNPQCEQNIARLLDSWESSGRPIVIIRHDSTEPASPLRPDQPGNQLKQFVRDRGAVLIVKSVHSCFHGDPDLHAWLQQRQIEDVAICGITTNHCCETTARVAADLGYRVTFISDATSTFDRMSLSGKVIAADTVAEMTFANLADEFAEVRDTASVLSTLVAS
ncbi:MAG: cysteine hydrolase family protein [Jatrophihabitans sp.]